MWILLLFSIFFLVRELINKDVSFEPVDTWRPAMFPENWQPIDKIGLREGINVFTDTDGIKDENGNVVSSGPTYHPYRFLHDFSYAGYSKGEKPIPPEDPNTNWVDSAGIYNVLSYGCTANGATDCRAAIQNAINDAEADIKGGIVYLPEGEYRVRLTTSNKLLKIDNSRVVLRGDGPDKTKIKVDPSWADSSFSMSSTGVIHAEPSGESVYGWSIVTNQKSIVREESFPTKKIKVSSVSGFSVADSVIIQGTITQSYINEHDMSYAGKNAWELGEKAYLWRRKIVAIDAGTNEITLDVPIRYRIKSIENPIVAITKPGISEIGIEELSIGMIRHPDDWPDNSGTLPSDLIVSAINENYAIGYFNVVNGWIFNVKSYRPNENANRPQSNDLSNNYGAYDIELLNGAIRMKHVQFITVKNFHFKNSQSNTVGCCGIGYTAQLENTNEVLFVNGTFQKMKKGFTINLGGASGNVFKDIVIREIFLTPSDFHSRLSTANLIDNVFFDGNWWESAVRPLGAAQGSSTYHGHSASQNVFWNVKGSSLKISARDYDPDHEGNDPGIVVSSQYGWGYIIGTSGTFSDVVTPAKPNRRYSGESWRPYILPRDYREGIGYDQSSSSYYGKTLCPSSLYNAQLQLRLTGVMDSCSASSSVCQDNDNDGYNTTLGSCGTVIDCNDADSSLSLDCSVSSRIIVDNRDAGFSSQFNWVVSKAINPYGVDSLYSAISGDSATWSFDIQPGIYEVYGWWTYLPSRSEKAPYEIYNGEDLLRTVRVNQNRSDLAGKWNLLGEYSFDKIPKVVLRVEGGASYSADAISLVKTGDISYVCVPSSEVCNGLDDDCDNVVDNGVTKTFYKDQDGDLYGSGAPLEACVQDSGHVPNNLDCDDSNSKLGLLKDCSYNGNLCGSYSLCVESCPLPPQEVCGNNIDENCDGAIDACSVAVPTLSVTYPIQGYTYKNKPVPLKYNAINAQNCWYVLDGSKKSNLCNVDTYLSLPAGEHTISIFANNSAGNINKTIKFKVVLTRKSLIHGSDYFEKGKLGLIEDYTDEQLSSIEDFAIVLLGIGQVEFLEPINLLSAMNKDTNIIDIDSNVKFSYNKLDINSDVLFSLKKRARVTFEGIDFENPIVLKDGLFCSDCTIEVNDRINSRVSFLVNRFSGYELQENSLNKLNSEGDFSYISSGIGETPQVVERIIKTGRDYESRSRKISSDLLIVVLVVIIFLLVISLFKIKKEIKRKIHSRRHVRIIYRK